MPLSLREIMGIFGRTAVRAEQERLQRALTEPSPLLELLGRQPEPRRPGGPPEPPASFTATYGEGLTIDPARPPAPAPAFADVPVGLHGIERSTHTFWQAQPTSPTNVVYEGFAARMRWELEAAHAAQQREFNRDLTINGRHVYEQRAAAADQAASEREMPGAMYDASLREWTFSAAVPNTPTPQGEDENLMESTTPRAKRIRKILLKYPFVVEHGGRSYRMSYHAKKRRWRVQEWENKVCHMVREEFVRGQRPAQMLRSTWMEQRTRDLVVTT
jgi:hypothetical protein